MQRFELVLNGRAVRSVHSVNDGEYGGETLFVWDDEKKSVVYTYFTTAGFYTTGTMQPEAGALQFHEIVRGTTSGPREVKATSRVLPDGRLHVKSQHLKDGVWVDGHEAYYTRGPFGRGPLQGLAPLPFVYILRCRDGSLYTGAAKDLAARLRTHAAGRASRYTRSRLPVRLAWSRRVRTWSAALREEHRIKRLTRTQKEALVAGLTPRAARAAGRTRARASRPSQGGRARAGTRGAGSRRRPAGRAARPARRP